MARKTEKDGHFDVHGGQYIPETLTSAVIKLEEAYKRYKDDPKFNAELMELLNEYAGRPSRLYYAKHMVEDLDGVKIYLKREDLNHTGVYKINNALGQALLTKYMGKKCLIAETNVGQHGVATTAVATLLNIEYVVYMGEEDTVHQVPNTCRMCLFGAEAVAVEARTRTLKDAVPEAMREWAARIGDTHYCIGSCMGSYPLPTMVRDFQTIISRGIKEEMQREEGCLPDTVIACVGSGSDTVGSFCHSIGDKSICLVDCEAADRGIHIMETAATVNVGLLGTFHGTKSYSCQGKYGQIASVHSISAGLNHPGVRPEHAYLHDLHRTEYTPVIDDETVDAFEYLVRTEGTIPAIESAHVVAYARKLAPTTGRDKVIIVTLSGRGNKDVAAVAHCRGENLHE